ncbi:MAG TPA: 50S ribosomal protein L29 [bacterium]|nr:50S ribosomal protein L29 [Candidatus Omnitrophota bacterium]HOJ60518.1 50S ribosomal protein L29 [bacterium]HOL96232.1 50S ribosomal protein L29 [bacterium]HPP02499.1 50S ribosomal protein L29 [bacterium]HXK95031.1 50S ribosomal protein L29 [bacterium]
MKADDFRSLSVEDLDARLSEMKRELFNYRMQLHSNQLSNTNKIRFLKRDIARALTVRREKTPTAEKQS